MSFALFLRGLIGVLFVFATSTYLITGSLWTTFIDSVVCAILVQVGYFGALLFLVFRSARERKDGASAPQGEGIQGSTNDAQPSGDVGHLPGVPRSRYP